MEYFKAMLPVMLFDMATCKKKNTSTAYITAFRDPILFCKPEKKLNNILLGNNFAPVIANRNYVYAILAAYKCMAVGASNYMSLQKVELYNLLERLQKKRQCPVCMEVYILGMITKKV